MMNLEHAVIQWLMHTIAIRTEAATPHVHRTFFGANTRENVARDGTSSHTGMTTLQPVASIQAMNQAAGSGKDETGDEIELRQCSAVSST